MIGKIETADTCPDPNPSEAEDELQIERAPRDQCLELEDGDGNLLASSGDIEHDFRVTWRDRLVTDEYERMLY